MVRSLDAITKIKTDNHEGRWNVGLIVLIISSNFEPQSPPKASVVNSKSEMAPQFNHVGK